ncbi:MAG: MFS transporter [bacterium]|nr:MFS transporter [bacterium]
MQTKRNIFLWVLYDFANSIVFIVFFLYFAQWVVIEQRVSDLYFNLTFTVAALLLLCTVPIAGVLLDRTVRRIAGLRIATVCTAVFYGLCALCAVYGVPVPALIFFTLGLFAYLFSFTFYTPLLNDIAVPERRGFISGLGVSANYIGQFSGLLFALPFANGAIAFFDAPPRAEALLPAVVLFFLLTLPMLFFFHEEKRSASGVPMRSLSKLVLEQTKNLLRFRGVAYFFLTYFLFNDAILTASNNFPIFLEQVWGISDTVKTYLLLAILVTSAIGGTLAGIIADRVGHKRTLRAILAGWILLLPVVGLITNFTLFVISTVLMGFWFGATWAVSRSVMSYVTPPGQHNLAFGYFGLAERASSFIGPLAWGAIVSGFVSLGSVRYRMAIVAVTVFIIIALFTFRRVPDERRTVA